MNSVKMKEVCVMCGKFQPDDLNLDQSIKFVNWGYCVICNKWDHLMDGWMTCGFTSFLTVFQSYQDDVRMIMKGCVQWNSVYG